jgi:predicted Zn-dependent peptidase
MSIINLKNPTDLSGFYVIYKGSTNLEKKGIYGISHLMEHLVCKALDPYQDELDRLGISHNAYTSGNEVVFHIKGLDKSISKWRNKFVDLLGQFDVTKEEFENERNIVIQEYMDSFNDQSHNHWLNLDRKKYNNFNPIGLKEDLEKLTWMDCLNYFEKQYSTPSSIINVSKNIEFGADMDFKTAKQNKKFTISDYPVTLQRDNEYKGKVSLIMSSELIDEDFSKIMFVNNMLATGLQSPFYKEIREKKGLVYYIGSSLQRMNTQGSNAIYTMSSAENINKITDIVGNIFDNSEKFLTKERFDVVKESIMITKEKQDINRYSSVGRWIAPEGWSIFDSLDTITHEETLEIANKYFTMDNYSISRDDQEFK